MANPKDEPIDIYERLSFFPNSDGTFTVKLDRLPSTPATPDPTAATDVLSKDIPINPSKATFARLFLPRTTALDHPSRTKPLPLIIYFHGGGFIMSGVDTVGNHNFCSAMSLHLPAVVVSIGYRLAPEHRLPAAYEDAVEGIRSLTTADEPWLNEYADFNKCYIMGTSAGGNIAYHAGLRVAEEADLRIRGLIMHHPFFGGVERTEAELRLKNNPIIPWGVTDFMWKQALPEGADRDQEYSNPTVGGGGSKSALEKVKRKGLKVMVTGCSGDPVIDLQVMVARMIEENGIEVNDVFGEGGFHAMELFDQSAADALFLAIKDFIAT